MPDYIWGRYPVLEALRSKRRVHRILVAQGPRDTGLTQTLDQARRMGVPVEQTPRRRLDDLSKNANHQGIMAVTAPRQYADVEDILRRAADLGEDPLIIALDAIQDVQNLGSLIRTGEVVGAHGLIIPEHRAAGLTPAVDKTSAGAVEFIPVAQVTNLTRTLDDLKKRGIWVIGLDGSAQTRFDAANLTGPLALVIGNEGKGITRLVREHCDVLIRIPMRGHIGSLNAAVAGSVALYEIWRQHGWAMPADPDAPVGASSRPSRSMPSSVDDDDMMDEDMGVNFDDELNAVDKE